MSQYIDKDALVVEIERRRDLHFKNYLEKGFESSEGKYDEDKYILSFLDTLEVKEVDLEKELDAEWNKCNPIDEGMGCEFANISIEQFGEITKHFFELGSKAQNCNSKCEDLRDDGICNFASTKLGRTMHCENISCSRRNKTQKGE